MTIHYEKILNIRFICGEWLLFIKYKNKIMSKVKKFFERYFTKILIIFVTNIGLKILI